MTNIKTTTAIIVFLFSCISILASSCKKELKSDVDLSVKSEDVIRKYLAGKWELCYSYGGYAGLQHFQEHPPGSTMVFQFNQKDSVFYYKNDSIVRQDEVRWDKLNNYDQEGPRTLIISCIANLRRDSLHLTLAPAIDASTSVWARK